MPYTPMMLQYFEIKNNYKDYILFYRLGDFYEMFFDDALLASKELELTLTGRDCGMEERAPMCGVPFHSSDSYITKLVKKGYKVAICEQTEDPATAKGLVKRDVVRVITPGTVTDSSALVETKNNYLCAICADMKSAGIAIVDITTADMYATDITGGEIVERLISELAVYNPSEVITNLTKEQMGASYDYLRSKANSFISNGVSMASPDMELLEKQFGEDFCNEHGISSEALSLCAVTALLDYVKETQKTDISYIGRISYYTKEQFVSIDVNTRRNLELCETMRTGEKKGTLLWVLDKTKTSAGARLLKKWIEQPLVSLSAINARQDAVKALYDNYIIKEELVLALDKVNDLERLMTKMIYGSANGRDMIGMLNTIRQIPLIKEQLQKFEDGELKKLCASLDLLEDIGNYIEAAIVDEPPFSIREGGFIRTGFSKDVDELRSFMGEGKSWIAQTEAEEREKTGIKNLKIGYNRVFGYYIEVTNSFKEFVPETYIRKQTLSNCERYITDELKKMEEKVLSAQDKVVALEYELFCMLREFITKNTARVQKTASVLAMTDVFASLADVAMKNNYVCPEVDYSDKLEIKNGRHPVVEKTLNGAMFVPNDTELDEKHSLMLITGPNMAGKSTYMRQNALIILMAQIGSFVPATSARIGVVDKIFTRVGASDDLASGQSTFMLEMNEVAYILKNATKKSFIVYDEIGRGTSTFDGMSIARAIAEYTAGKKIGAKTMFATHYHELTILEEQFPCITNYSIAAKKRGDDVVFLRKIVKGAADDSYGIEVAKLAGVPNTVIKRAREILASLEGGEEMPIYKKKELAGQNGENMAFNLTMEDAAKDEVFEILKRLDINTTSPIEALQKLFELKKYTE